MYILYTSVLQAAVQEINTDQNVICQLFLMHTLTPNFITYLHHSMMLNIKHVNAYEIKKNKL